MKHFTPIFFLTIFSCQNEESSLSENSSIEIINESIEGTTENPYEILSNNKNTEVSKFLELSKEYTKAQFNIEYPFGLCAVDTTIDQSFEVIDEEVNQFLSIKGEVLDSIPLIDYVSAIVVELISVDSDTAKLTIIMDYNVAFITSENAFMKIECSDLTETFRSGGRHLREQSKNH